MCQLGSQLRVYRDRIQEKPEVTAWPQIKVQCGPGTPSGNSRKQDDYTLRNRFETSQNHPMLPSPYKIPELYQSITVLSELNLVLILACGC